MSLLTDEGAFTKANKDNVNNQSGFLNKVLSGSADVGPMVGYNLIESSGVDAITLALPTPAQDGQTVAFYDNGGMRIP